MERTSLRDLILPGSLNSDRRNRPLPQPLREVEVGLPDHFAPREIAVFGDGTENAFYELWSTRTDSACSPYRKDKDKPVDTSSHADFSH